MPVAHSDKTPRLQSQLCQLRFERPCLSFGEPPNGRGAADGRVMMLNFARPGSGNQLCKGFAPDAGKGKINNVRITEEVIKERLYRSQRIWPAQLKQNYPHTARCLRHSCRFPRTGEFTLISCESQCQRCQRWVGRGRQWPGEVCYGSRSSLFSG